MNGLSLKIRSTLLDGDYNVVLGWIARAHKEFWKEKSELDSESTFFIE